MFSPMSRNAQELTILKKGGLKEVIDVLPLKQHADVYESLQLSIDCVY